MLAKTPARQSTSHSPSDRSKPRFGKGYRMLGEIAEPAVAKVCKKFGFTEIGLFRDWAWVVGPELAAHCTPVRVASGGGRRVLHVRAEPVYTTQIAHSSEAILDRINRVYGGNAVTEIRVVQTGTFASLVKPRPAPLRVEPTPGERADVEAMVENVDNAELRDALRSLGLAIRADDRRKA